MGMYIVVTHGNDFLGWGSVVVSEYPDARQFFTRTEAAGAIATAGLVGTARVVSTEAYAAGAT
jgi:hypothetical protein